MTPEESDKLDRASRFILRFGKFKGSDLEHTPSSYLKWLAENSYSNFTAESADIVWRYREENDVHFEEEDL